MRKILRKRGWKTDAVAVGKRFCFTLNRRLCNFFKLLILKRIQDSSEFVPAAGLRTHEEIPQYRLLLTVKRRLSSSETKIYARLSGARGGP